jgi:putative glutathione S-transferase
MTGMFVEGKWQSRRAWTDKKSGTFHRRPTTFRDTISTAADARFQPASGRYRLYLSHACPWAHRTLITRALRGLTEHIDVSIVHPFMGEDSWSFHPGDGVVPDPDGAEFLREVYLRADPNFTGVVTVPVLWDTVEKTIVNNESREIIRMFDAPFDALATGPSLAPAHLRTRIDAVIDAIYQPINNGVYRTGFARTQSAYTQAVTTLFAALEEWDGKLSQTRFTCGAQLTEADICLFTTLIRFDAVYHTHFKCNHKRIADFEHLSGFLRDVYQTPGVRETVHLEHITRHYYESHESINPYRIVPIGPALDWDAPHGRA